ncbi:MAG: T9SS type A sorting domain-containing protein [Ignavibacterium sp.]|jgi:hypothetical protein|nr:T9SS type A sorting domain-containing protein [Ignavibacterium sp.]
MKLKIVSMAISLFLIRSITAQWSTDPGVNMVLSDTITLGSALNPVSVSDGNGGAIIVWSRSQIYGQRVSSSGNTFWGPFGTIVGLAQDPTFLSSRINPVVIPDDSGGAIIAYGEYNNSRIIAASKVKSDGSIVWDKLICFSSTGTRKNPSICSDGEGGAIITWEDTRNGSTNSDIYAQRVNSSGTEMWGSNGVILCDAVKNQTIPKIASDGLGGAFITWADSRTTTSRIYAQRVNSLGQPQWGGGGMLITSGNEPAGNPKIAASDIGQAIITWANGNAFGTWDVFAQKVNQDTTQWATNGVSICNEIRTQWKPEIVADGFGGAIISWQDTRRISFDEEDVYAQKISTDGIVEWGPNGVPVCTQPGNSNIPQKIASDGDGGAIIAWEDRRNGNTDIFVQRVHRGGSTMWTLNGVAVSTAQYSQIGVTLIGDGHEGAILAWMDQRRGAYLDIYGQGIDSTGSLGSTTLVENDNSLPASFNLYQNYPNPFNPITTISYQLPVSGQVSLKVYDVLGKEIATLVNEEKPAGSYEVDFNAAGLSSGIYFYKLSAGRFVETKKMIYLK